VLRAQGKKARIYVNGLLVAEEENFLFSYNVTKLSSALRRALNRERTNVGRGAYSDRVKAILLACTSKPVGDALAKELERYETGAAHDELLWMDVQLHACQILSANEPVVFVTSQQMFYDSKLVDYAKESGNRIVVVPTSLSSKLRILTDIEGKQVRDLDTFYREWDEGFSFTFVDPTQLDENERDVFGQTKKIMRLYGPRPPRIRQVLISETMRTERSGYQVLGLWREEDRSIVIKRDQLHDIRAYAGTLLHELTHAANGSDDRTLEFESDLTRTLGEVAKSALGAS